MKRKIKKNIKTIFELFYLPLYISKLVNMAGLCEFEESKSENDVW